MTSGSYLKSPEHRQNLSNARLLRKSKIGYLNSSETRTKISQSLKGNIPWNKGKKLNKLSEEHKRKLSLASRGKPKPWQRGKKPWNFINGLSYLKNTRIYGDDWSKIRMIVYKRDNYTCQKCAITMNQSVQNFKMPLHVHHIIPFIISNNNFLDNLITLCPSCHLKEDNRIRKDMIKRLAEEEK